MEKCPIDLENAHYDELFYFALYGKPGVLKDDDPVLLTFMNQRLPPEKQVPVPEVETDDPILLDLLGKKKLPEPPHIVEKLPEKLKEDAKDEDLPVYRRSYIVNFDWSIVKGEYRALDYDKYIEVDENRPTARMCRLLTMVIFKLLVYLEQYLLAILKKSGSDMSMINDKIQEYKCSGSDVPRKLSWLNMYGMPYFKDNNYFACPSNEDVQRKNSNNELLVNELHTVSDWNALDCHKLEQAIRGEEIVRWSQRVKQDGIKLSKSLSIAKDEQERAALIQLMSAIPSLERIRTMPLKELCEDTEWEYDWLKIAAQDFNGYKHPDECRGVWRIYLHPKRNRGAWTDEENEKLKELVADYNFQNWEAIAQKLGTNRTALLVMQHYQRNLNESFINKVWTDEEDELLKKLVQTCKLGSRISWKKIAQRMKGHTKEQIFKRWTYLNPAICKGPFSKNEDMLLVAAVRSFGEEYSKLLELFPYRSREQLRYRYRVLIKLHPNTWDASKNEKLLSLVDRFGEGNWKKISEYFEEQTPASLKEQYTILQERMAQLIEANGGLLESREIEEEKVCEERKLWRKVQQFSPVLKEYHKLDHRGLKELKEMLIEEAKMVPQSMRTLSSFDKQCYTYFKCVSDPDTMYENDLYENKKRLDKPHVLKYILHLLQAKLQIPKEGFLSSGHSPLQIRDERLLQQLSKESFMVSEARQVRDELHLRYSLPANITTLCGFCSILLHRLYILGDKQQEKKEKIFVKAKEADSLFKKRFRFLFLWPALSSVESPAIGQPSPFDNSVAYSSRQPVRKGRKRKPTRVELLNIIGPRRNQCPKTKRKQGVDFEEGSSDLSDDAKPSVSDAVPSGTTPSTSSVDRIETCTVVEIKDESIYQTLLASEKNKRLSLPSASLSSLEKEQTNTRVTVPSSPSEENRKKVANMPFTSTSLPYSSVSEKNTKQRTNIPFTSTSVSSVSERNEQQTSNSASYNCVPPSVGTFSFNSAKCIRTYSRVKKPKTQPPNVS